MAKAPAVLKDPPEGDLIEKIEVTAGSEQTEIEPATPDEIVEDEPVVEDASAALQKQVEALKKSEEIHKGRAERYREEAEKAQQTIKERVSEVAKVQKEAFESQLEAVSTALGAAQAEAESAKRDIKTAINSGDVDAQTEAYERLATARSNISKLEDGKFDLEARIKNPPKVEEPVQQNVMPERVQRWINKNQPDQEAWDLMRGYHHGLIRSGLEFDSDEYLEAMEIKLGWRKSETEDEPVVIQQRPQQRTSIVSAPVSREAPSTPSTQRNGDIKLTVAQREAAKIAGVTEKVYAEQLQKIAKMKANGSYGDRQ